MSWPLSIYLAGVITALAFSMSTRTGDKYTDTPILGCIVWSLLWPAVVMMYAAAWLIGDLD